MKKENIDIKECCSKHSSQKYNCHHHGDAGAIYGLGVIGALFYFLQHATGFTMVLLGIGKAIFWPAVLLFKVLTLLQI